MAPATAAAAPVQLQLLDVLSGLGDCDSSSSSDDLDAAQQLAQQLGPPQAGIIKVVKKHLKRWENKVVKVVSDLSCKRRALANFHNKTVLAEGQLVAGGSDRLAHRGGKSHTNKWTAAGTCYNSLLVVAGARAAAATRHTLELVAAPAFACRGRQQEHIKTVVARLRTGLTGAEWLWVERCWDETPMSVKFSGTSNSKQNKKQKQTTHKNKHLQTQNKHNKIKENKNVMVFAFGIRADGHPILGGDGRFPTTTNC